MAKGHLSYLFLACKPWPDKALRQGVFGFQGPYAHEPLAGGPIGQDSIDSQTFLGAPDWIQPPQRLGDGLTGTSVHPLGTLGAMFPQEVFLVTLPRCQPSTSRLGAGRQESSVKAGKGNID